DHLTSLAHPDGGWGYAPGQPAHLEPTCLGLLALSLVPDAHADIVQKAKAVLAAHAAGDGTYRLERGRPEAVWPTALVLFVQCALDYPSQERDRTAGALLRLRGGAPRLTEDDQEIHDIDLSIVGWAWADGNFS